MSLPIRLPGFGSWTRAVWPTDTGAKVTDPATCRQLYPAHGNPRMAAGEPLTNDYLKCQLEPVRRSDYPAMTNKQFERLKGIFRSGVCDYDRAPAGLSPLEVGPGCPTHSRARASASRSASAPLADG